MMADLFISIGNHLWQSTLFALCVAVVAFVLRRIPARTRFWLWMAALVKFLVPFSLLMALGNVMAPHLTSGAQLQPAPYYSVDQISQPFTYSLPAVSAPAKTALTIHSLPAANIFIGVALVWAAGLSAMLCSWILNWRHVMAILRNSCSATDGIELEVLSRVHERMKLKSPVALVISDGSMEPGIVGIRRPTLVWPRGISERLEEEQIEAIIAHELAHVRRRDNFFAALAMLGAAIFWFHPLVLWLKSRAMDARELACDEEVILLGNEPEVYASSILRACEFSIESPLACVSGITGSDLKDRVRRIMSGVPVRRLSRRAVTLLVGLCAAAILIPVGFGFLDVPRASAALLEDSGASQAFHFEVATIKPTKDPGSGKRSMMISPGRFYTENIPLRDIIMFAYDAKSQSQISGYPDWVASTHYDIEAKEDEATVAALDKLPRDDRGTLIRLMLQGLLAERFQLKISREVKELPVYALVIAKGGPKISPAATPPAPGDAQTPGNKRIQRGFHMAGPGKIEVMNAGLDEFAGGPLSRMPETDGRVVIDKTGLTGNYNFTLKWTPEALAAGGGGPEGVATAATGEEPAPGLFTALEEQLGLKLESQKGSVEGIVINHVEQPSPN